jgi:PAS domain S-box-containing protein
LSKSNNALAKENKRRHYAEKLLDTLQQAFRAGPVVVFRWRAAPDWPVESVSESIRQFSFNSTYFKNHTAYRPLIHPRDVKRVEAQLAYFGESDAPLCELRYRLLDGNGDIRWVYDCRTAMRDVRGKTTHYQGYLVDLTEQRRTARILRQSEARFGALISMLPCGVIEIDTNAMIISANQASAKVLGYTLAEFEKLCLWSLLAKEQAQLDLAEQFAHVHASSGSYQTLIQGKDRVSIPVQLDWKAVRNPHGKISAYVLVMTVKP